MSTPFASRKPLRIANRKPHHIANRKVRYIARHIANRTCLPVDLEGEAMWELDGIGGAKKNGQLEVGNGLVTTNH